MATTTFTIGQNVSIIGMGDTVRAKVIGFNPDGTIVVEVRYLPTTDEPWTAIELHKPSNVY